MSNQPESIGRVLQKTDLFGRPSLDRCIPLAKARVTADGQSEEYRYFPEITRVWGQVEKGLRTVFYDLAQGPKSPRKRQWPLYLSGGVGSGKTRAALCFCDIVHFARYWTVDQLIDSIFRESAPWNYHDYHPALAVLDELAARQTALALEYDAIKRFCDWREDRPAIYISNHPPKKLLKLYDERLQSRLICGTVYELKGPDRRLKR